MGAPHGADDEETATETKDEEGGTSPIQDRKVQRGHSLVRLKREYVSIEMTHCLDGCQFFFLTCILYIYIYLCIYTIPYSGFNSRMEKVGV